MTPHPPNSEPNAVVVIGAVCLAWYTYQVVSRKQEWISYKLKKVSVTLIFYLLGVNVLAKQGLPLWEVAAFSALAGLGSAWLLVQPPRLGRRVPKAVRREVIARDLTSKGLKWDSEKYHIDHVVPRSRGGDHSARNLRVIEKQKNLSKGSKMPSFWDFLSK